MGVSAQAVADYVLASVDVDRGDSITNLKLQKLLYYAQGWHLVLQGEPLFADDIQAWPHGPAVYAVWKHFSDFGWHALDTEAIDYALIAAIPDESCHIIDQVISAYSHLSASELEESTHGEDPWKNARRGLGPDDPSNRAISHEDMRTYFAQQQ